MTSPPDIVTSPPDIVTSPPDIVTSPDIDDPAAIVRLLLRSPAEAAQACVGTHRDRDLRQLARVAIACLFVGSAAFGATVGSLRGGSQIAFAALKMPVALLGALIVACPAFLAFAVVFGRPLSPRSLASLALASGARGALVLLACAPPLWLAIDLGLSYPATKLAAVVVYGGAGLAALGVMGRGLEGALHPRWALVAMIATFLFAGGQSAWVLRPFLGDPRDREVPLFVQQSRKEGGLAGALSQAVSQTLSDLLRRR